MLRKVIRLILIPVLLLQFCSCAVVSTRVGSLEKEELQSRQYYVYSNPVKAHLKDGSIVLYKYGFTVKNDTIRTSGEKYDYTLVPQGKVYMLPVSNIESIIYYDDVFHYDMLFLTVSSNLLIFMTILLMVALGGLSGTA